MDKKSLSIIGSRAASLYLFIALVGAIFIGRLFYLQIVRHDFYQAQALAEHESKFSIPAERGTISALDGSEVRPLVLNQTLPTLYVDPQGIRDHEEVARELSGIIDVPYEDILAKLSAPNSRYEVLARKLTLEQSEQVSALSIGGLGQLPTTYRAYPQSELAAHSLGFVNADGQGQYGIEEALQEQLAGEEGRLKAVTDVFGIPLSTIDSNIIEKPVDGDDITLTIDVNLQRTVEDTIREATISTNAVSASALVIEAETGAIKALANYPTYNPGELGTIEDFGLLTDHVVSSPYETGSGVKVFTLAAGLSEGVIEKDSTYLDTGSILVDDIEINNATFEGAIIRSMTDVIQRSVNTGVVHVLEQLGGGDVNERARTTLHSYFDNQFGFGAPTGVELANEAGGILFGPNEGDGVNVRYANMSFGQGMTVTMMQMAAAMASVVNGGTYYQPYLVHEATNADNETTLTAPKILKDNVVSSSVSQDLIEMMRLVVEDGGGRTAKRDGYLIGGKTGTAQVPDGNGQYSPDKTIGSFTGFVGSSSPEYIIMTRINEPNVPGFAGTEAAAPTFAKISNWLIDYYQIPPQ